jgi:hypothetical protein
MELSSAQAVPVVSTVCGKISTNFSIHKSQTVFTETELRVSGLRNRSVIDIINFHWKSPPETTGKFGVSVGMASVFFNTLSSLVKVRRHYREDAATSDLMRTGTHAIVLTTPFIWDGNSSIVIDLSLNFSAVDVNGANSGAGEMLYSQLNTIGRSGQVACVGGRWVFAAMPGVMGVEFTTGCTLGCRAGFFEIPDPINTTSLTFDSVHLNQSTLKSLETAAGMMWNIERELRARNASDRK